MSYLADLSYGSVTQDTKPSMYEHLTPSGLSTEQLSHFVEWFSGDTLDSIWNLTSVGGGTTAMDDSVDGGLLLTSGTSSNDYERLNFNGIDHYAHDGSVFIGVSKRTDDSTLQQKFLGMNSGTAWGNDRYYFAESTSGGSNYRVQTWNNPNGSLTDTGVAKDANWHVFKGEAKTSSVLSWIDGIMTTVNTGSSLPDAAMSPFFEVLTETTAAKSGNIRYLEVYNT